ncbi:unnamed protein product [Moneuplotes crassus]|uniref:Uncharacterized protein n=1 Tax=Euplotes crassus TaxID=5936 RepID=A0AAD1XWW4_EUPCR|nr:unnamed protein product [Moneuplotes crassus]
MSGFGTRNRQMKHEWGEKPSKIKRAPRINLTVSRKTMKGRFLGIKSCSPRHRILRTGTKEKNCPAKKKSRNIAKSKILTKKNTSRVLSPAARIVCKLIKSEEILRGSSSRKSSKKEASYFKNVRRMMKLRIKHKPSKFTKSGKSKKSSNLKMSRIFESSTMASTKANVSVNQRYINASTMQTLPEQIGANKSRQSEFVCSNLPSKHFEVYNSMNQEENPGDILAKFLPQHVSDSSADICFPTLDQDKCRDFLGTLSQK